MNSHRSVFRALLVGKAIRAPHWAPGTYMSMAADGYVQIFYEDGTRSTISSGLPAAAELFEPPPPPNPHAKGTFSWMLEELCGVGWAAFRHGETSPRVFLKDGKLWQYRKQKNGEPVVKRARLTLKDYTAADWMVTR